METSNTRRLSCRARDMLDFIDHDQFDAALLDVEHQLHEQDLLVIPRHKGVPAFQDHAPEEGPGRLLTDGGLNADDGDAVALLFDHGQVVKEEPVQVGRFPIPNSPPSKKLRACPRER